MKDTCGAGRGAPAQIERRFCCCVPHCDSTPGLAGRRQQCKRLPAREQKIATPKSLASIRPNTSYVHTSYVHTSYVHTSYICAQSRASPLETGHASRARTRRCYGKAKHTTTPAEQLPPATDVRWQPVQGGSWRGTPQRDQRTPKQPSPLIYAQCPIGPLRAERDV